MIHALLPSDSRVPHAFHREHMAASLSHDVLIILRSLDRCVYRDQMTLLLYR